MGTRVPSTLRNVPTALRAMPATARAIPTAPRSVPSLAGGPDLTNLVQWQEADFGLNVPAGTWADRSGGGNNCTFSAGSPVLNPSSLNGLPGITLDGASAMGGTTDPVPAGGDREIYFIIKPSNTTPGLFASWRRAAPAWIADGRLGGPGLTVWDDGSGAADSVTGVPYVGGNGYIVNYRSVVGSPVELTINGIAKTITGSNVTIDNGTSGFQLGCYYGLSLGLVGDFIGTLVYSAIQSTAARAITTGYIAAKYAL